MKITTLILAGSVPFALGFSAPAWADSVSGPITVTATIVSECSVTSPNADFGPVDSQSLQTSATISVNVKCSNGTPYTLTYDGGSNYDVHAHVANGVNKMPYIIRQSGFPAGSELKPDGTNHVVGTGTGINQPIALTASLDLSGFAGLPLGTYTDTGNFILQF